MDPDWCVALSVLADVGSALIGEVIRYRPAAAVEVEKP
jgi:hypothetical protein